MTDKPNFVIVNSSEITKEMVNKYLDNDYHKWIANVLTDICNDPHCIYALRKQIKEDWDLRNMLKRYDKTLIPMDKKTQAKMMEYIKNNSTKSLKEVIKKFYK